MDTRRTLVSQKPTVSQTEKLDESKKERQQQRFKVAYPLSGGDCAMDCYCCLINVHDNLACGKTA